MNRCAICDHRFTGQFTPMLVGRERSWALDIARGGRCRWCIRRLGSSSAATGAGR